MHKINYSLRALLLLVLSFSSCKKYLDERPDKALAIPATVEDCQAILDNNAVMNRNQNNGLGEASSDNYYLLPADYNVLYYQADKSTYTWGEEIFYENPPTSNDWVNLYNIVYRANTVIKVIEAIAKTGANEQAWNNVYGSALFFRAWAFSVLTFNFSKAYDVQTAHTDLGIPLRLTPDFNIPSVRASVQQSYDRIIGDLTAAIPLLPDNPAHIMRPSKPAVYALLARVFLSMRNYTKAGEYAALCLQLKSDLIDYNSDPYILPSAAAPFTLFNQEIIFYASGFLDPLYRAKIKPEFFNLYVDNDLRKTLFFRHNANGTIAFKGHYAGSIYGIFCGIATDEVYLMQAEALARQGHYNEAMNTLNTLLEKRWKQNEFIRFTADDAAQALVIVLAERRKQLIMRDLRWMDIKRLNKEGAGISLEREMGGQTYQLLPGDNKFALPLPATIIKLTGMPQNPR